MNEGHLGKFTFGGERAATDDHPVILHALPLAAEVTGVLQPGTLLKSVAVAGANPADVVYAPFLSTDTGDTVAPCAVVDKPCDSSSESSAICIVHGTVKTRLLITGDAKAVNGAQIAKLNERGIFAV